MAPASVWNVSFSAGKQTDEHEAPQPARQAGELEEGLLSQTIHIKW